MNQKEIMEKVKAAKSAEEIMELFQAQGQKLTQEEAKNLYDAAHTAGELSDAELGAVAGGGKYTDDGYLIVSPFYGCKKCTNGLNWCTLCGYSHTHHDGWMYCEVNKQNTGGSGSSGRVQMR